MRLLSFDTSGQRVAVSLMEDGNVTASKILEAESGQRQDVAVGLMPAVDELLRGSGWQKSQIDVIVVGQGPGSFTGIRTAVVTARTLAQALNLPLIGVGLLAAFAVELPSAAGIILSGGRGHYYFAAYAESENSSLLEIVPPGHGTGEDVAAAIKEYAQQISQWYADLESRERLGDLGVDLKPLKELANVAESQARLAWRQLSLSISAFGGRMEDGKASHSPTEEGMAGTALKSHLLDQFQYRLVEPLYLRGASVTLKGSHGQA